MVVEAAGDVLRIGRVDRLRHVQNLRLPSVLPPGFGPEETLIANPKHH